MMHTRFYLKTTAEGQDRSLLSSLRGMYLFTSLKCGLLYLMQVIQLRNDFLKVSRLSEALGLEIEHALLLLMESYIVV